MKYLTRLKSDLIGFNPYIGFLFSEELDTKRGNNKIHKLLDYTGTDLSSCIIDNCQLKTLDTNIGNYAIIYGSFQQLCIYLRQVYILFGKHIPKEVISNWFERFFYRLLAAKKYKKISLLIKIYGDIPVNDFDGWLNIILSKCLNLPPNFIKLCGPYILKHIINNIKLIKLTKTYVILNFRKNGKNEISCPYNYINIESLICFIKIIQQSNKK